MSEFSQWRKCIEGAATRLQEADSTTQPLLPKEERAALSYVVAMIRKTLPKMMRRFLEAMRPPPEPKVKLGGLNNAELQRLTAQQLGKSRLGPRVVYAARFTLDRGHPGGKFDKRRVSDWLSATQDFLDEIERRLT